MHYTLDSVTLVKEALEVNNKEVNSIKQIHVQLDELKTPETDVYYFGLVTVGENPNPINFVVNNEEFLKVIPNNQLTVLFNSFNDTGTPPTAYKGTFLGHKITLKAL